MFSYINWLVFQENLQEIMTIKQDLQNQHMVKHEVIVSK
jgi:hypothetical protein